MSRTKKVVISFSPDEHERILDCIYHALNHDFPRMGWPRSRKVRKEIYELYQKWGQFLGEEIKIPLTYEEPTVERKHR